MVIKNKQIRILFLTKLGGGGGRSPSLLYAQLQDTPTNGNAEYVSLKKRRVNKGFKSSARVYQRLNSRNSIRRVVNLIRWGKPRHLYFLLHKTISSSRSAFEAFVKTCSYRPWCHIVMPWYWLILHLKNAFHFWKFIRVSTVTRHISSIMVALYGKAYQHDYFKQHFSTSGVILPHPRSVVWNMKTYPASSTKTGTLFLEYHTKFNSWPQRHLHMKW